MRKSLMIVFAAFTLYSSGSFSMSWGELEMEITATEAGKTTDGSVKLRLIDIVQTIVVYTKALNEKSDGSSGLLFCMPKAGSMNLDQVVSMIRHQARQEKAESNASIQGLMLRALEKQYSCVAK